MTGRFGERAVARLEAAGLAGRIALGALRLARSRRFRRALGRVTLAGTVLAAVLLAALWQTSTIERADFVRPVDAVTVTDRHGEALRHARSDGLDRRWVELAQVSPHLINAVLAVEDSRFYDHEGVDLRALVRAALFNVLPGHRLSGASTISQQLIKLVYGRPRGLLSKPSEIVRAIRLEELFDKDEILEQYLNRLPFGDQIVGVGRASEEYFGIPASALTISEAALLAGIPQAPSVTEPRRHLRRALARRRLVLERMRLTGRVDEATYRASLDETPTIRSAPARPWRAPRFVDAALADWREGELERIGSELRTSLDLRLQQQAETVLRRTVEGLGRRGVEQGAAVVLANATGEALAYVGAARRGAEFPAGEMDLLRAPRQPGSTLKPFIYELLFERGGTAATILDDLSRPMTGAGETIFEAEDYDGFERGPVRARVALASSLNLAALDAARQVGPHRIVARLRALGVDRLEGADHYGAAIVLGGADISPLELAECYMALARGGTYIPSSLSQGGRNVAPRRVMEPGAVAVVRDILTDPRTRADAFGSDLTNLIDGLFGLKTGTSSGWHDAWAVVFTDLVTVVVWLGDPAGNALGAVSGFSGAAEPAVRILAAADRRAHELGLGTPQAMAMSRLAEEPEVELVEATVCADSGLLAGERCPHSVREVFVPGTLPARICTAHREDGAWLLPPRYAAWLERARPAGVALPDEPSFHAEARLRITHPQDGARLLLDRARGETRVPLRAELEGSELPTGLTWEVDGAPQPEPSWTARTGRHTFVAVWQDRRSAPVEIEVLSSSSADGS